MVVYEMNVGKKTVLWRLFSDMTAFTETTLVLYGKKTKVKYQCLDLTWKTLDRIIRFVVVDTEGRGKMILMCSDLTMHPEDIITIYCMRFKIETSFDEQKNDIGNFSYHFWTPTMIDVDPELQVASEDLNREYEFRKKLVAARKESGLTQRELGEKSGIPYRAISRMETNSEISPNIRTVLKSLSALVYELDVVKTSQ